VDQEAAHARGSLRDAAAVQSVQRLFTLAQGGKCGSPAWIASLVRASTVVARELRCEKGT
jgi:hypothetical protein